MKTCGKKKKKKNNPSRTISINRNQVSKTRFLFMETEYKILNFYWEFFFSPNYANKRAWKSMLIRENDCRNCTLEIKLCLNLLPKSGKKFKWNVVHQSPNDIEWPLSSYKASRELLIVKQLKIWPTFHSNSSNHWLKISRTLLKGS